MTRRTADLLSRGTAGIGFALALTLTVGCATIPKEAPELSLELGKRIGAIESSHMALLNEYFREKRAAVDRYIDQVWIPTYSAEIMQEPAVANLWTQVCREGTDRDRLEFLRRVGPRIQRKINEQRQSMIQPLDDLERTIATRLRAEYDQARSLNNTLTSFLSTAAEVDANRKRYLEMLGIKDEVVAGVLDQVDATVADLAVDVEKAGEATKKAGEFRERMRTALAQAKSTATP